MFNSGRLAVPVRARHRARQHGGAPGAALRRASSASSCADGAEGVTAEVDHPLERGGVSEPLRALIVDDEPLARTAGARAAGGRSRGRGRAASAAASTPPRRRRARGRTSCSSTCRCRRWTASTLLARIGVDEAPGGRVRHRLRPVRAPRLRGPRPRLPAEAGRRGALRAGAGARQGAGARRAATARLDRAAGRAPRRARPPCPALPGAHARDRRSWWTRTRSTGSRPPTTTPPSTSGGQAHLLRETLTELAQRLDPARFFRVHRSAIVNLERVREIHPLFRGDCELVLRDGTRVRLSRTRRREFQRLLRRRRPAAR